MSTYTRNSEGGSPEGARIAWPPSVRETIEERLAGAGFEGLAGFESQWAVFLELVKDWNATAHLISAGDENRLVERHLIDSLSMAGALRAALGGGYWADLGSGGGFPAIPLKVLLPDAPLVMVERSAKKVGFLRKAVARLGLRETEIVHASFPEVVPEVAPDVITVRAIERPERIVGAALDVVGARGTVLALQREERIVDAGMFHVERIIDEWSRMGLRRGTLLRIQKS